MGSSYKSYWNDKKSGFSFSNGAKHRICPDAKATSYVGSQNAIEKTPIPKPKIENKTEKKDEN